MAGTVKGKRRKMSNMTTDEMNRRHRYIPFTERLASVDASIVLRSNGPETSPLEDGQSSHFRACLVRWREIRGTIQFVQLFKRVKPLCKSLPMLIFNKERIVEHLLSALQEESTRDLEPILSLTHTLARDLGTEFYPYCHNVMKGILQRVDPSDPIMLEQVFSTVTWIFKFVSKALLKNMEATVGLYRGLLSHKSRHVRSFAGESFAYLMRRMSRDKLRAGIHVLLDVAASGDVDDALITGLATVLFECVKGVQHGFHSNLELVMEELGVLDTERWHIIVAAAVAMMLEHSRVPKSTVLLQSVLTLVEQSMEHSDIAVQEHSLDLLRLCIEFRHGARLDVLDRVYRVVQQAVQQKLPQSMQVMACLLSRSPNSALQQYGGPLCAKGIQSMEALGIVMDKLHDARRGWSDAQPIEDPDDPMWALIEPCLVQVVHDALPNDKEQVLDLLCQLPRQHARCIPCMHVTQLCDWMKEERVLSSLYAWKFTPSAVKKVGRVLQKLRAKAPTAAVWSTSAQFGRWYAPSLLRSEDAYVMQRMDQCPEEELRGIADWLDVRGGNVGAFPQLLPVLTPSLASPHSSTRAACWRILSHVTPLDQSGVVDLCYRVEICPREHHRAREMTVRLQNVLTLLRQQGVVHENYHEPLLAWLHGLLHVRFAVIWKDAIHCAVELGKQHPDALWSMWWKSICSVAIAPPVQKTVPFRSTGKKRKLGPREAAANAALSLVRSQETVIREQPSLVDHLEGTALLKNLLRVVEGVPSAVRRHAGEIVPRFLQLVQQWKGASASVYGLTSETLLAESTGSIHVLEAYLRVFAGLDHPKGLVSTNELQSAFVSLLSAPYPTLQQLALECCCVWCPSWLMPYKERLERLIEDDTYRAEMTEFSIQRGGDIESSHRALLIPVLVAVMAGKMFRKPPKSMSRGAQRARRVGILAYLCGLEASELDMLFLPALAPFERAEGAPEVPTPDNPLIPLSKAGHRGLKGLPIVRLSGFVHFVTGVLEQMPQRTLQFATRLVTVLLSILQYAEQEHKEAPDASSGYNREIRSSAVHAIAGFMDAHPTLPWHLYWNVLRDTLRFSLSMIRHNPTQHAPASAKLMRVMSRHAPMAVELLLHWEEGLMSMLDCLSDANVSESLSDATLSVIENLLALQEVAQDHVSSFSTPLLAKEDAQATERAHEVQEEVKQLSKKDRQVVKQGLLAHLGLVFSQFRTMMEYAEKKARMQHAKPGKRQRSATSVAAGMCRRQLAIMARWSGHVKDPEQANALALALLPYLDSHLGSHVRTSILQIFAHLMPLVADPPSLVMRLSKQWGEPLTFDEEQALSGAFAALADRVVELQSVVAILRQLHAYRAKSIGEPDFDIRLAAYASLTQGNASFPNVALYALAHTHSRMMHHEDLALRQSAASAMDSLLEHIAQRPEAVRVITSVVMPALKQGMRERLGSVRNEYVHVLRGFARLFPQVEGGDLSCLLHADDEADTFLNLVHMQVHRRVRAVRKILEAIEGNQLSESTLSGLVLPLIAHFLAEKATGPTQELVEETIRCIGMIARQLPWKAYNRLLMHHLRSLGIVTEDVDVRIVRTVCAILDGFHFGERASQPNDKVYRIMVERVIPQLEEHMVVSGRHTTTRASVALALIRVLCLLPEETMHRQASRLVRKVAALLKDSYQDVRDDARKTLCGILTTMGCSKGLALILPALQDVLARGHARHILGYTVSSLVLYAGDHMVEGELLDDVRDDIVPVLMEDWFGTVAQEKLVEKVGHVMKETGSSRAADALGVVVRHSSFPTGAIVIVSAIEDASEMAMDAERLGLHVTRKKCTHMLHCVALGVTAAKEDGSGGGRGAEDARQILLFARGALQKGMDEGDRVQPTTTEEKVSLYKVQRLGRLSTSQQVVKGRPFSQHLVEFALGLMLVALRRGALDASSDLGRSTLNPIVPMALQCLGGRHAATSIAALKCLTHLVRLPLSSMERDVHVLVRRSIEMMRWSTSTSSDMAQNTFRLITALLRHRPDTQWTDEQLDHVIDFVRQDMLEPDRQNTSFALVRAILARRLVSPKVYDLMNEIQEQMVKSHTESIRRLCGQALVEFLVGYPLSRKRLRQHMEGLAKNLTYVYETGREAVLEALSLVIERFPRSALLEHVDFLFLPLMVQVVGDESSTCRTMAAEVTRQLLRVCDSQRFGTLLQLVNDWYASSVPALLRTAAQALGLFVDTSGPGALPRLRPVLEQSIGALKHPSWEVVYHTLCSLEKLFKTLPTTHWYVDPFFPLWKGMPELLEHPHAWVRLASVRLLGRYFGQWKEDTWLSSPGCAFGLAQALCVQMKSEVVSSALAEQSTRCLLFVCRLLHTHPEWTRDDQVAGEVSPVGWVFRRLSFVARRAKGETQVIKRTHVLQWFAAMMDVLTPQDMKDHLVPVVAPCYRLAEDEHVDEEDPIKLLSKQVLERLRRCVGTETYMVAYTQVRQGVLEARASRKRQRVMDAALHPELATKRKYEKNQKKKIKKKKHHR